jgi:polysaccharide export outer membrane protein
MVKTIGTVVCPALVFAILAVPLGGCGLKVKSPSESGRSQAVTASRGTNTGIVPATETGGLATTASTAMESGAESGLIGEKYRIGPEDVLRISVWNNKDLTMDPVVRPDGKISVPLIQDIQAAGLTAAELSDGISKRLVAYIKDPQVSVIVLQVNSPKFFVVGEVSKPGPYPLRGSVSVLQALSISGGFTTFASPGKIRLVRNSSGKQEVRVINYYRVIEDGGNLNYLLRSGDTLVVP